MSPFQQETISLTTQLAQAFSLPKSVGQVFGLIFASAEPLSLDDIESQLGIARGSAHSALSTLLRLGAIKPVHQTGVRRTHYQPEVSLRRLVQGIINETMLPHLRDSREQIDNLDEALRELPPEEQAVLIERLRALQSWQKKARTLLPFLSTFLGKPLKKKDEG